MKKTMLMLHFGDNGFRGSEMCFIQSVKAFAENGFDVVVGRNFGVIDTYIISYIGEEYFIFNFQR